MMKLSVTKSSIVNGYFFLFVFGLIHTFYISMTTGFAKESWQVTEFLINYEGGFVRRGLLGELIFVAHQKTGISPYAMILVISISAYVALAWFFFRSFVKKGYTIFVLPFVFFLGNPIISNFLVRKDTLLMLVFIATIYFALKRSKWNLIAANLVLIFGLLIHEGIGFVCFPIVLLIYAAADKSEGRASAWFSVLKSLVYLLPALTAFASVLYFKGSEAIASQIWDSWETVKFPIQNADTGAPPAAIDGISWTLKKGLGYTVATMKNFESRIYAPLAWSLIVLVIYYVSTNTSALNFKIGRYQPTKSIDRPTISAILVLQLLTVIPLFVLGWDYGRWIFYWITSGFAILLLVPEKRMASLFPGWIHILGSKLNAILDLFLRKSHVLLLCLFLGFCGYSWDLLTTVKSNSVVIVLQFVSTVIVEVLHFIRFII